MPRPSLQADQLAAMRRRLAGAALAIYRERGLSAVSFRRVAEACEVSHTLIYRYFADKDALLAHARADCFREFEAYVRAREAPGSGARGHVHSVARAYVDFARERPGDYQLMFSSEQPPPDRYPDLLAARRSLFEHAVAIIAGYIERGALHGDPRFLAHALWVNLHGLMLLDGARQLVHGMPLEALAEPLVDRLIAPQASGA